MTIKHKCTCVSPYQDAKYGKNIRVMNLANGRGSPNSAYRVFRCTVCETEHTREVKLVS